MKQKWFDLARKVSYLSDHPQHKIGAVIVKGNSVLSMGCNKMKTHTQSRHPHRTLHAEMAAILKANTDLRGSKIYIYRETKGGVPAISKPCVWCSEMIASVGIKEVFHS